VLGSVATAVLAGGGTGAWQIFEVLSEMRSSAAVLRMQVLGLSERIANAEQRLEFAASGVELERLRHELHELRMELTRRGKP